MQDKKKVRLPVSTPTGTESGGDTKRRRQVALEWIFFGSPRIALLLFARP